MNDVSLTLVKVSDYLESKGIFVKPPESIASGTQLVTEQKFADYNDTGLRLLISDLSDSLGCLPNSYEINSDGEDCHINITPVSGTDMDETDSIYFTLIDDELANPSDIYPPKILVFSMKG